MDAKNSNLTPFCLEVGLLTERQYVCLVSYVSCGLCFLNTPRFSKNIYKNNTDLDLWNALGC